MRLKTILGLISFFIWMVSPERTQAEVKMEEHSTNRGSSLGSGTTILDDRVVDADPDAPAESDSHPCTEWDRAIPKHCVRYSTLVGVPKKETGELDETEIDEPDNKEDVGGNKKDAPGDNIKEEGIPGRIGATMERASLIEDNIADVTNNIGSIISHKASRPIISGQFIRLKAKCAKLVLLASAEVESISVAPAKCAKLILLASTDEESIPFPFLKPPTKYKAWVEGFGGWGRNKGDSSTQGATHNYFGNVLGIDKEFSGDFRAGVFFGVSRSNVAVEYDSQRLGINSIYGGVYGGRHFDNNVLDFSLTTGTLDFNGKRSLEGDAKRESKYSGYFFNSQVTFAKTMPVEWGVNIIPSWQAAYTRVFINGYDEAGGIDNLSVESRTLHLFQSRLQVALNYLTENKKWETEGFIGIDGRLNIGADKIDLTYMDKTFSSVDLDGENKIVKGFAGLNLSYKLTDLALIKVGVEGGAGSDQSVYGAGNIKIEYRF